MMGDSTMKLSVWFHLVPQTIALHPARATAAPAYPPISACDDDDGSPNDHVMMFQASAPTRPASTTLGVTMLVSIIPEPIAFATAVPTVNAARKLNIAAH